MDVFQVLLILALHVSSSLCCEESKSILPKSQSTEEWFLDLTKRPSRTVRETTGEEFSKVCGRGQFVNLEGQRCEPCPFDHFMPDALHSQLRCYSCQHAKLNSPEMELIPCTPTADTVIGCKEGYFLQLEAIYHDNLLKCYPCTKCKETNHLPHEIRPCGESEDTLCCPNPDMRAVWKEGEHAFECRKQTFEPVMIMSVRHKRNSGSLTCGAGQFLEEDDLTENESCKTCPDGTFMAEKRHTWPYCHSCHAKGRPRDSVMGCISKKEMPVVVACLNNKYICYKAGHDRNLRSCCECTPCQHVGQKCTNNSDTICCPKANMRIVNGECQEEIQTSKHTPTDSFTTEKDNDDHSIHTSLPTTTTTPSSESPSTPLLDTNILSCSRYIYLLESIPLFTVSLAFTISMILHNRKVRNKIWEICTSFYKFIVRYRRGQRIASTDQEEMAAQGEPLQMVVQHGSNR